MAYNTEYRMDMPAVNGWRYRLAIRPATSNVVVEYDPYPLPKDSVTVVTVESSCVRNVGFVGPTTMQLRVSMVKLGPTVALRYLRTALRNTCVISGGVIHLNAFILTSDLGDESLDEDDFKLVAATTQKPTLKRETDLSDLFVGVTIDTVDICKIVLETTAVEETFSCLDAGQVVNADIVETPTVYEWYRNDLVRPIIFDGISSLYMRKANKAWSNIAGYIAQLTGKQVRKKTLDNADIAAAVTDTNIDPFAHVSLFKQQVSGGIEAKTAITSEDVYWVFGGVMKDLAGVGFEYVTSGFSPCKRYDNWFNFIQAVPETVAAKSRIKWSAGDVALLQTRPIWSPWADEEPAHYPWGMFKLSPIVSGYEVLKSMTVTCLKRNEAQEKVTQGDITEFETKSMMSIADAEHGIKELLFDNLPEARGITSATAATGGLLGGLGGLLGSVGSGSSGIPITSYVRQPRIWFNQLYALDSGRFVRLHHHVSITDGMNDFAGEEVTGALKATQNEATQAAIIRSIQERNGGLPRAVSKTVFGAFGRIDQALMPATCQVHERFMPMQVGDVFYIDAPDTAIEYTSEALTMPACLLSSSLNFAEQKLTCNILFYGSRETL